MDDVVIFQQPRKAPRKVVLTWMHEGFVDPEILPADDIGFELKSVGSGTEEEIIEACRDADGILTNGIQDFSKRVLTELDRCRVVVAIGIGYNGIDVAAATELGICVANNPRYCVEELADHTLALLLALARRIVPLHRAIRDGEWDTIVSAGIKTKILAPIRRISTLTLGIVGFGNAGRTLARKARGLGLNVVAYAHHPDDAVATARELQVSLVSLEELLRQSDFVSLQVALNAETRGLIGLNELRLMKPTAYLLNTSRGKLVDPAPLVTALSEGWIAGVGLDVMDPEPLPADSPLLHFDNAILTPHSAYYSLEAEAELWQYPFEEVVRVLRGKWPIASLNPEVKPAFVSKWGPMTAVDL